MDLKMFSLFAQDAGSETAVAIGVLLYLACIGVSLLIGILLLIFWVWMIVDCATKEPGEGNDKIVWILLSACFV